MLQSHSDEDCWCGRGAVYSGRLVQTFIYPWSLKMQAVGASDMLGSAPQTASCRGATVAHWQSYLPVCWSFWQSTDPKAKVHHRVHKSPPMATILKQFTVCLDVKSSCSCPLKNPWRWHLVRWNTCRVLKYIFCMSIMVCVCWLASGWRGLSLRQFLNERNAARTETQVGQRSAIILIYPVYGGPVEETELTVQIYYWNQLLHNCIYITSNMFRPQLFRHLQGECFS
jgi:hypothetical protein